MIRLGLMAMAAQLRHPGQSTAEAAAERGTARSDSPNGGNKRERHSCDGSAGAQSLLRRRGPIAYARNGTRDKDVSNGTKGMDRKETTYHEEKIAGAKGNGFEEHQWNQLSEALLTRGTPGMHIVTYTAINIVGVNTARKEQASSRTSTGRRLALTSPRPAWPRCAWTPAAPRHGVPKNSPEVSFFADSERYHQDLDLDHDERRKEDPQTIAPTYTTITDASPTTTSDQSTGDGRMQRNMYPIG